jgi:hypothetical protein
MKYAHVKIVAKAKCPACNGEGVLGANPRLHLKGDPCMRCHATGETETELLHPGEPFFLLRGQDLLTPVIVLMYATLAEQSGVSSEGLDELRLRIVRFQQANPGLSKLPD